MSFNSNEEDTFRSKLLLPLMNIEIDRSANQTPNNEPINEKYLEWLIKKEDKKETKQNGQGSLSNQDIMYEIFKQENLDNDQIIEKIKLEVNGINSKISSYNVFIHDLVISMCRGCYSNLDLFTSALDVSLFKKRCLILPIYINANRELEMETLMAIEAFDNQLNHDNKNSVMIRFIFDTLSEEKVICEGVFWKWKKNSDQDKHIRLVRRLKDFFTREAQVNRDMRKEKSVSTPADTNNVSDEWVLPVKDQSTQKQNKKSKREKKRQNAENIQPKLSLSDYSEGFTSNQMLPAASSGVLTKNSMENKLMEIFNEYDSEMTSLYEKIKAELARFADANTIVTLSKKNIKILVNALCLSCYTSPDTEFKLVLFLDRCMVLKNFINKNQAIELEVLNTIKSFVQANNCKPGTELTLANILFGNSIISEASFNKWNQIENKNETPKNLSNKTEKKFNNSKKTSNTEAKNNPKVRESPLKDSSVGDFQPKTQPISLENEARASKPSETTKKKERRVPTENLYQRLEYKLIQILSDEKMKNPKIFHKIELEFDESERSANEFNKALITAICKSCLKNEFDFNALLFRTRCPILDLFISQNEKAQLEVLVAIEKFCEGIVNCPALILTCIFETLLWEELIEENIFFQWKLQADQKSVDLSREFFYKLASAKLKEKPKEEAKQSKPEIQAKPVQSDNNLYQHMNMSTNQPAVNLNYFMQTQPSQPAPLMPNYSPFPGSMPIPPFMHPSLFQSFQMHQPPMINMMNNSTPNSYFGSNKNKNSKNPQINSNSQASDRDKNFGSTSNLNKTKTQNKAKNQNETKPKDSNKTKYTGKNSNLLPDTTQETEPMCPICIETIPNLRKLKTKLKSTNCGHIICEPCSEALFKKNNNQSIECPICRKKLTRSLVHDLFI